MHMESCQILLQNYYNIERVCVVIYLAAMFYVGSLEADLHAFVRKNCGL